MSHSETSSPRGAARHVPARRRGLSALPMMANAQSASPDGRGDLRRTIPDVFAIHGQTTVVEQAHDAFRSPYEGANSLSSYAVGRETFDATLFGGVSAGGRGAKLWINPEIDQGFGLSDTLGLAGFPQWRSLQGRQGGALFPAAAPLLPPDLRPLRQGWSPSTRRPTRWAGREPRKLCRGHRGQVFGDRCL